MHRTVTHLVSPTESVNSQTTASEQSW